MHMHASHHIYNVCTGFVVLVHFEWKKNTDFLIFESEKKFNNYNNSTENSIQEDYNISQQVPTCKNVRCMLPSGWNFHEIAIITHIYD